MRELYNEKYENESNHLWRRVDETIQPHSLTVDEVDGQQVSTSMTTRSFYVAVAHRSSTYMLISPPPFYRNGDGRTLLRLRNPPSKKKTTHPPLLWPSRCVDKRHPFTLYSALI